MPCRSCTAAAVSALSHGVLTIVKEASSGAHIPPSIMHSAQDAIAADYSFLQQHGAFLAQAGSPGRQAICSASEAMIATLQVSLLHRQNTPMVAHTVAHCAAAHLVQSSSQPAVHHKLCSTHYQVLPCPNQPDVAGFVL